MDDVRDALRLLIERHLATLATLTASIRAATADIEAGGESAIAGAGTAYKLAHQIAGAAGSIGFAEVSVAGRALEDRLRPFSQQALPPSADELALIRALADRLSEVVAGQRPESSTLYDRDLTLLHRGPAAREA